MTFFLTVYKDVQCTQPKKYSDFFTIKSMQFSFNFSIEFWLAKIQRRIALCSFNFDDKMELHQRLSDSTLYLRAAMSNDSVTEITKCPK